METFIHQQYLEDISICDEIVDFHKKSNRKEIGAQTNPVLGTHVDKNIKDSVDVLMRSGDLVEKYVRQLKNVSDGYNKKYPWSNRYGTWGINEPIRIQYYPPGGGYKDFHSERTSNLPIICTRHLVFMTYLNDVTDQGGTEFFHQGIITQAKKGMTLIWPADWTHTHRGVVSPSQEKYIITGWFNYMSPEPKAIIN